MESFGSIDDLIKEIKSMSYEYDLEMLEKVRQSLFKRYNQVLRKLEGNEFEVEYTGTRKRQCVGGTLARLRCQQGRAGVSG